MARFIDERLATMDNHVTGPIHYKLKKRRLRQYLPKQPGKGRNQSAPQVMTAGEITALIVEGATIASGGIAVAGAAYTIHIRRKDGRIKRAVACNYPVKVKGSVTRCPHPVQIVDRKKKHGKEMIIRFCPAGHRTAVAVSSHTHSVDPQPKK